jgi:hypothetical protein
LKVEQTTEFFVSMTARSHLSGAAVFLCVICGAAVLMRDDRPAIRAVLWEGAPTLSDSYAKPSSTRKVASGAAKGGTGKARRGGRRSSLGDVGHALSAAYKDTLQEEIPADILALLGKLD